MIRAACLRALALVLLATLSGGNGSAQAEQSEPAQPTRQADAPAPPAPSAPGQNPTAPAANPAPVPQPQTAPANTTPAAPVQTPVAPAGQAPIGTTGQNPVAPRPVTPQPAPTGGTGAPLVTPYPPPGKTPPPAAALIPNDPIMTPAQQVYGVPRNPVLNGPVDFDLTRPLSLDRAIRIGLLRQNTIAVAVAQTDVARASLTQARASYYPQVSPSFQFQANVTPGSRTVIGSSTSTTTGGTGGTITGPTGTATNSGTSGTSGTPGTTASASALLKGRGARADSGTGSTGATGTNTGTGSGLTPGQSSGGSGTSTGTTPGTGGTTTGTGGTTTTTFVNGSTSSDTRTELVAAQLNIYDSGRREANVGFARRSVFAAEYGLGNQRQNVILTVTEDYYNLLRSRELVRVQDENVRRAQTTLEAIQAQVQAGAAAQSDTLQAQSDLANSQINLLSAQNDVRIAEANLKNAMGVVATPSLVLADTQVPAPNPTPDKVALDDYVQTAYINRLDLKQQQEIVNAQGYNVRIAHINNGVTVNASISEGYQLNPDAGEERSFVVSVGYPLFDGGTTRAGVRASKATLESDRRDLDALQQNVRLDIEQQYYTRELARQRVVAANVAVQAGQLNYQAALEKQRNGLVNILEVLNAQVQLITAQVSQVQAIYDYYIADARLSRDIGQNDANFVPDIPGNRAPKRQYTRKP